MNKWINLLHYMLHTVAQFVEALCYKLKVRGIFSRWRY